MTTDRPIEFLGMSPILSVREGLELQLVEDGRAAPDSATRVYFLLRGVDVYHAECVEHGADIVMPVDDRPFGVRDFRVADRSGNVLGFGEPLAPDGDGAA